VPEFVLVLGVSRHLALNLLEIENPYVLSRFEKKSILSFGMSDTKTAHAGAL
jgi:hypothetical protein